MDKPVTTNDNKHRFTPDHEYAEQWARDTLSGRSEGGAFSTGERNLVLAYLDLLRWKSEAMQVMSDLDLQAIGKEMDLKLGSNIASEILPYIRKLKGDKP